RTEAQLEAVVALVEALHVARAEIGLQGLEDVVDGHPERFDHRAIDVEIELRAVGVEWRGDVPQRRLVIGPQEDGPHRLLELAEPRAGAILYHHLDATSLPHHPN